MWLIQHAEEDSLQNQNVHVFWSTWIKGTLWHLLSGAAFALCFGFILWSPAATKEGAFIWVQQHRDLDNLPSLPEGCCMNVSEGYVSCLCLQPALQKPNHYQIIEGCFCKSWMTVVLLSKLSINQAHTCVKQPDNTQKHWLHSKFMLEGRKKTQHNSADFFLARQRIQASSMGPYKILKPMPRVKPRLLCI